MKAALLALVSSTLCVADLRMASQPRNGWKVINNALKANSPNAVYLEPSDFNYNGLKNQRKGAYDNFLRSNVDNEQDKRNFDNEDGKDMLPFRTFEAARSDVGQTTVETKLASKNQGPITVEPGKPFVIPLRWNNPHASELEVNIWISENKYVVPILKPVCAGEGYQDAAFAFTVPKDFNSLTAKVPGFNGCKKVGDCVLQVYAHSVETRVYTMGTPLIVNGDVAANIAGTDESQIEPAKKEVGTDLSSLRELCLPSNSPDAIIGTSIPRKARYVSDVYNHAYQNSDYSPYSGQQPESISKNLQAACVARMITGNRGELGRALLKKENPAAFALQDKIEKKWEGIYKRYEQLTNKIIGALQNDMKTSATLAGTKQVTAQCFRCAESGSVETGRDGTNTYVPSFQIPTAALIDKARNQVPKEYASLITDKGVVQIYVAALNDMSKDFQNAAKLGLEYQPAMIKVTAATMPDATNYKKIDANKKPDKGVYAASKAQAARKNLAVKMEVQAMETPLAMAMGSTDAYPYVGDDTPAMIEAVDMDAIFGDKTCDDDAALEVNPDMECKYISPAAMFEKADRDTSVDSASSAFRVAGCGFLSILVTVVVSALM